MTGNRFRGLRHEIPKADASMNGEAMGYWAPRAPAILAAAALACALLIVVLRPLLKRYAMARPNARSSHKIPTPQGGGLALIAATIGVSCAALYFFPAGAAADVRFSIISAAIALIAGVGILADFHPENIATRLLLQTLAVTAVIFALPPDLRALPFLPLPVEKFALVIGGLWFVNLVNFMDGLDWMTVVEVVPITAALYVIGLLGVLPPPAVVVSLALCGATLGFAYFNRPVAKLFLGDVGSLPIGLLLGWLLILIAGDGGRAAAVLLPLYYLADSTITLFRRALNGEQIWQAHRSHFYQRATDRGFSVIEVVVRVFVLNLALSSLAVVTIVLPSRLIDVAALVAGGALVVLTLVTFERGTKAS
jgi:UDP-N-acetylmuramyl pentapeptide phosphotransferase/UDP-N-acetylglucosamine-1-phosphate transferase